MEDPQGLEPKRPMLLVKVAVVLFAISLAAFALYHIISTAKAGGASSEAQTAGAPPPVQAPPAPVATQATNPPSGTDTPDSPNTTEGAQTQTPPTDQNCYDNSIMAMEYKATSETRSQFAEQAAEKMGVSDIYVSAGGEANKYLLFVATPENEAALRQWEAVARSDGSMRANLCTMGFAETQFIVRDADMNQKLIGKFQTNASESFRYMQQRGGATPVQ